MPIRIDEIKSLDWQQKLKSFGDVVENIDDIDQCIGTIVTTQKGSRPHEPLFGTDLLKYIDQPINIAIPGIILETIDAVNSWEPRVTVKSVDVLELTANGHGSLRVNWKLKDYDFESYTEVNLK
ncbi:MAG: GPW/gp25 family protein [Candidatus Abawacabacteria bacterium]|nr:GPW/gp25 family protein [Candidatus Abawacabacteria bacterium]